MIAEPTTAERENDAATLGAGTMEAMVMTSPGLFERRSVPLPEPGPGEVRVALEGCGICSSSMPLWEGREWFTYPQEPGTPGHEGWGRIDALGDGVDGLAVGERVAMLSHHAYADRDVVAADSVVPLPASLDGVPFPGEPLGCAVNIFRRCAIEPGQTVAIVGVGFLGALLVRLASRAGARVIALARRGFALDIARDSGADRTILMDDHWKVIEQVKELTGGEGCERVIEATGKQWPLDLAAELSRERGRLIIAGYHQDGLRQVNMQLWNWRGLDVINAHERDPKVYIDGIREGVNLVASGEIDPAPLYTHTYTFDRLAEAFEATRTRPDGFIKALVLR